MYLPILLLKDTFQKKGKIVTHKDVTMKACQRFYSTKSMQEPGRCDN